MADGPGHRKDVSNEEEQPQREVPTVSTEMDEEAFLEEVPIGSSDTIISTRGTRGIYIGIPDRT